MSTTNPPLPTQIEIISHIAKLFGKREIEPRHFKSIIKAANIILAEFSRESIIAKPGAGLNAWINSDDTGLSSHYMAGVLNVGRQNFVDFAYPHDAGDFGRCYRLLRVAPELLANFDRMKDCPNPWPKLHENWALLEKLYVAALLASASRERTNRSATAEENNFAALLDQCISVA